MVNLADAESQRVLSARLAGAEGLSAAERLAAVTKKVQVGVGAGAGSLTEAAQLLKTETAQFLMQAAQLLKTEAAP